MTPAARRNLLIAAAAVLAIIFGVRMAGSGSDDIDPRIASVEQRYVCSSCGETITLTVAEAAALRREKGDIVCPKCGNLGARKQDVRVAIEGGILSPPPATSADTEPPTPRPNPAGGLKPSQSP